MDKSIATKQELCLKAHFQVQSMMKLQFLVQKHESFPRQFCSYKELRKSELHKQHIPQLLGGFVQQAQTLTQESSGGREPQQLLPACSLWFWFYEYLRALPMP